MCSTNGHKDLRDKHKRWRLIKENNRKLEAQSRRGTRTPTTAHAAAVYERSLRGQPTPSPLELGSMSEHSGATMPPGLGFAIVSVVSSSPSSTSELELGPNLGNTFSQGLETASDTSSPSKPASKTAPISAYPLISIASEPVLSTMSGRDPSAPGTDLVLPPPPSAVKRSSSAPGPKPQILMPHSHYLNVHSHYAQVPARIELDEVTGLIRIPDVMQSYDYGRLNANGHIGFKRTRGKGKGRMPARKAIDLEKLPPLSSPMALEIMHRNRVHEQAAIFAKIRSEQEKNAELQRRANRASQHQAPPFNMLLGALFTRNGTQNDAPTPPITPAGSPSCRSQQDLQIPERLAARNEPQGRHIRWAPNLIQQQQKVSNITPRRQRPPPIDHRQVARTKSTLSRVTTGSMGRRNA